MTAVKKSKNAKPPIAIPTTAPVFRAAVGVELAALVAVDTSDVDPGNVGMDNADGCVDAEHPTAPFAIILT